MAAVFGKRKIYSKWGRVSCKSPSGTKNLDEIALSCTVKETAKILHFKIQNGRHFLKIGERILLRHPAVNKIRRNCSISHL